MATLTDVKRNISLHNLAQRLDLVRPKGSGNYKSPHHDDTNPSLSILKDDRHWRDFSGDDKAKGSCIDLVMYVRDDDFISAVKWLRDEYQMPEDPPAEVRQTQQQKSTPEWIAERCFEPEKLAFARQYLIDDRGIDDKVVKRAIATRSVGFNDYTSHKHAPGEPLHGGPAVAFVVRSINPGKVMAVDTRYLDPALNGGVKTQCMGERFGHVWTSDLRRLEQANSVYVVESPINALSVESAGIYRSAAIALRGTGNASNIDFRFLRGKRVIVCMDADLPNEKGHCPGPEAAWTVHERLLGMDVAAMLVDQAGWEKQGWNDINDILQQQGADEVASQLKRLQPWLIPGLPGEMLHDRKARIFLPPHDAAQYWRFRCKEDFISCVKREDTDEETGEKRIEFQDVCGFRVAGLSKVRIASYIATTTGEKDAQPETVFSVSVQAPRHGHNLVRKVFNDDQLFKLDRWEGFGPIYAPIQFKRLINIMERSSALGGRDAVNFVGLAWRDGKPIVNEGQDCYFREPAKQCPYHNLTFPSGTPADARRVIEAYQATFTNNAALQLLVWSMGCHLKTFLGFWPHMMVQADKGTGKTTLIKRLESSIAFTMFSSESIKTLFRMLTSVSCTSHPVGWEEFSTLKQVMIDEAVSNLQQTYQFSMTRRGSEMTEYLLAAPVLLAGEDVPVRSLLEKSSAPI